jgi:cellulose biosynthesis protein BcsQ
MPSGNVLSNDYWSKLSNINWHELLFENNSAGVKLLFDMFGRIQSDEMGFDYVLIDARAGITPLSGLCVSLFGDVLASFFTASPESLYGTRQMLMNIRKTRAGDGLQEIPIFAVLTRFEKFDNKDDEDLFILDKKNFLKDNHQQLYSDLCVIHAERELERNERIIFGEDDSENEKNIHPEVPIKTDYLKLFSHLVDDVKMKERVRTLINRVTRELLNDPDWVQAEVENISTVYGHKLIFEELIKIYKARNVNRLDQKKFLSTITHYFNIDGRATFIDDFYFDSFIQYIDNFQRLRQVRFLFDFERLDGIIERKSVKVREQFYDELDRHIKGFMEIREENNAVGLAKLAIMHYLKNREDAQIRAIINMFAEGPGYSLIEPVLPKNDPYMRDILAEMGHWYHS